MPLTAGTRVGPFLIGARIGSGGMGEVYRATDTRLGRDVALKVLREGFALDEGRVRRFEQEARAAAAVTDPHIVVLYDVGTHEGAPYLVTELLEGQTLREVLTGPLPRAKVLELGRQLASALVAAHARGVVHRDLKPENLFVTNGGLLKVLDFGIARLMHAQTDDNRTDTGALLGTVGYMAPEQVRGQSADHRADLFAAGCILYELASGRRAFQGATKVETGYAVLNSEPPPLGDAALDAVVRKCLEKPLERRMSSASELDGALAELTRGGVPVAPRRRNATRPILATLAVFLIGGAGGAFYLRSQRGIAITDHPAPEGRPEAQREYRIGLQAVRDASLPIAVRAFERAAQLDPSMAAAHLRAALYVDEDLKGHARAQHLAEAHHLRAQLDERDEALLEIAEGILHAGATDEARKKARVAASQHPNDAEVIAVFGWVHLAADTDTTLRELDHALELDPRFAYPQLLKSFAHAKRGDVQSADADLARCLELSSNSTSCLSQRALRHSVEGRCREFAADAERLVKMEPDDPKSQDALALALASSEAPPASLETALARVAAGAPDGRERQSIEHLNRYRLAALTGDFPTAREALVALERMRADEPKAIAHEGPTYTLMYVLEESGDPDEAIRVADEYISRAVAWQPDYFSVEQYRLALLRHLGRISDADHRAQLEAISARREQTFSGDFSAQNRKIELWVTLHRATVPETAEQAEADLKDVPEIPQDPWRHLIVARRQLEAGHVDKALPTLRRNAAACNIMVPVDDASWEDTFTYMQTKVLLGEALEQTHDTAGACEAYGYVARRWKNAKPRSVTLEKALERSKALGCLKAE